jgi:small nuclear ribonucleoprotein (snRNP)-like protein
MSPTAVLNPHIKSYSPYFNIILAHVKRYGKYRRNPG